jgi:hypothetical protein
MPATTVPPPFPAAAALLKDAYTPSENPQPCELPGSLLCPPSDSRRPLTAYLEKRLYPRVLCGRLSLYLLAASVPSLLVIRPLHYYTGQLQWQLVPNDNIRMHLLYAEKLLFLTPLPAFLLSYHFWVDEIAGNRVLEKGARTLLASWCALVRSETDYHLAKELRLLPECVDSWSVWANLCWWVEHHAGLAKELRDNRRYRYGVLNFYRVNLLKRVFVDGYRYENVPRPGKYVRVFGPLVLLVVYVTMVLAAFQLMVDIDQPGHKVVSVVAWYFACCCLIFFAFCSVAVGIWALVLLAWSLARIGSKERYDDGSVGLGSRFGLDGLLGIFEILAIIPAIKLYWISLSKDTSS